MANEKLVYGGYVSYPLAPKDVKNVQKLVDQYTTPDDLLSLLVGFAADKWGVKIEPILTGEGSWKVVVYNLTPVLPEDNHAYYISGESDSLLKALCVVRYKADSMKKAELSSWVSAPSKSEYR